MKYIVGFLFAVLLASSSLLLLRSEGFLKDEVKDNVKHVAVEAGKTAIQAADIEEHDLARLTEATGLEGLNETTQYVEEDTNQETSQQLTNEQISYYQTFVTPSDPAVISIASGKTPQQIYETAISWVWVEDEIINEEVEKWLLPNIFLTQTPNFASNPVQGMIASDCESQAYTLVSALRASGMPAEHVRVVTGLVNFGGGNTGGHAWAEVFDTSTSRWFALEATSGNYYNSDTGQLQTSDGLPFDYFKRVSYPSVQLWNYFNDVYFYDLGRNEGIVPENWNIESARQFAPAPAEITYELPEELKNLRDERIKQFQERRDALIANRETSANTDWQDFDLSNVTQEDIQNQVLLALDHLEGVVESGLTEQQQNELKSQADMAIDTAYLLLDQSNLSNQQKAELTSYLVELESYLDTGLNKAQKAALQASLFEIINQAESSVESGEVREDLQDAANTARERLSR